VFSNHRSIEDNDCGYTVKGREILPQRKCLQIKRFKQEFTIIKFAESSFN
jgi:hypothetical protein